MKPAVLDPVQKVVLLSALPCPIIPASAPAQHPHHGLTHLLNLRWKFSRKQLAAGNKPQTYFLLAKSTEGIQTKWLALQETTQASLLHTEKACPCSIIIMQRSVPPHHARMSWVREQREQREQNSSTVLMKIHNRPKAMYLQMEQNKLGAKKNNILM